MVTLGLTVVFAVIVAISALVGLVRGMNKAVIRIMTLVLAVVLTFVVAGPVTMKIAESVKIEGLTLGEMILELANSTDAFYDMIEAVPLVREVILVAPAFVMSIVVFPVVFFLLSFVSWILFLCVQKPLRKLIFKDSCNKEEAAMQPAGVRVGKRFAGLGIGVVTGVLIFAMILTPVFGLLSMLPAKSTMDDTLSTMVEQGVLSAADAETIRSAYAVTDSPLVKFYGMVGVANAGKAYMNSVSTIEVDGLTISLADELDTALSVVQTALEGGLLEVLLAAEDRNALFTLLSDKTFVDTLMQNAVQSKILHAAIPEVMVVAMESVANSMDVPASKEAVYHNMMDDIALAVKNAQIDYAAIKAYEDANGIVYTHARSASSTKDIMTEEEYEAEIQKLVELTNTISSVLNHAISGNNTAFTDSVAAQIVNEVKVQAAENGQDAVATFDANSVQSTISNINAADIEAGKSDAGKLLEQLADEEKFETDVATLETIREAVRESVKNAFSDETKAAETASTLANVVSNFAEAVSSATDENGNIDAAKLDFEKIATAVTSLQNSALKDVGSSVLDIVVSGELGQNSLVSDVLGAVKEGYEKGEDIAGTINTAGALIGLGSAMGNEGEAGQEAMVNSLTSLINNLNDFTIGLLPTILSADTITSMGVPAEYAEATYSVIETLLTELMKLKGAEDYTNEVNSILSLYNLATSGVEQFTEEDVAGLVSYALESDAIYNTLMSVSTSNPFGIQIEDEAVRAELINGIEEYYAQSGKTEEERNVYTAVATLLGLDGEVNLK